MAKLTFNKGAAPVVPAKPPIINKDKLEKLLLSALKKKFPLDPIQEINVFFDSYYSTIESDKHLVPSEISIEIKGKQTIDLLNVKEHRMVVAPNLAMKGKSTGYFTSVGYEYKSNEIKVFTTKFIHNVENKMLSLWVAELQKQVENSIEKWAPIEEIGGQDD